MIKRGQSMEYKLLVCQNCGYKEKIIVYNREEAEKRKIQLVKPRCKKCGSYNIKLYDSE